jgi:hypothetical protein
MALRKGIRRALLEIAIAVVKAPKDLEKRAAELEESVHALAGMVVELMVDEV